MKMLIGLGIFLMLLAPQTPASFVLNCTSTPQQIEDMEYGKNLDRKMFAHDFQVANMNQLKYSPALAKHASDFKSCADLKKQGATYRIDGYSNKKAFIAVKLYAEFLKIEKPLPQWIDEGYNPKQTSFVRCYISDLCTRSAWMIHDGEESEAAGEMMFFDIYGPWKYFSEGDIGHGPPGYMCRYGHKDGLCQEKGSKCV
ncbi:hypothetical protein CAEBREN_20863 [Caenorhabditis brenneri]|uniref:SCP domain-containing protein n=1 Tax=Caenorhabditis brenneri TaxID=135651 RepID=G0MFP4_CAEBE|nr:hypothetical protein CAEBREN_20863 [Caenorhabditis brenneri]